MIKSGTVRLQIYHTNIDKAYCIIIECIFINSQSPPLLLNFWFLLQNLIFILTKSAVTNYAA